MTVDQSWARLISSLRDIRERGAERPAYYQEVHGLLDRLLSDLVLYDDLPSGEITLAHYTSWGSILEMLKESSKMPVLRMYNYEQVNDPKEGKIKPLAWETVEKEARESWVDGFLEGGQWMDDVTRGRSTYGCSFSSGPSGVEDDLTYWRLYGNDGRGCSLKISMPKEKIYKVRYRGECSDKSRERNEKEDADVAKRLRTLSEISGEIVAEAHEMHRNSVGRKLAEGLLRIMYGYYHLVKHIDYAAEKEWRMVRVMPKPNDIQFNVTSEHIVKRYVAGPSLKDFLSSASTITIGPTVPNQGAARAYVQRLAEKHDIRYVSVRNSRRTYRQR